FDRSTSAAIANDRPATSRNTPAPITTILLPSRLTPHTSRKVYHTPCLTSFRPALYSDSTSHARALRTPHCRALGAVPFPIREKSRAPLRYCHTGGRPAPDRRRASRCQTQAAACPVQGRGGGQGPARQSQRLRRARHRRRDRRDPTESHRGLATARPHT